MTIEIWSDGSAKKNGDPNSIGGCSAIIIKDGIILAELSKILYNTTCNIAELEGIKLGIEWILASEFSKEHIHIVTDSSYCEKVLMKFGNKSWRNLNPKKNSTLIRSIRELLITLNKFNLRRVKGHCKSFPLNCKADSLAKQAWSLVL